MALTFENKEIIAPMTGFNVNCVYTNGTNSVSGSANNGIFYSNDFDSGIHYSTNVTTGSFSAVSVVDNNAVMCSSSNGGLYYSTNTGTGWSTWNQSNV